MKKLLTKGIDYTFDLYKVLEPIYNQEGINEFKFHPVEEKVVMGYKENAALSGGSSMPLDDFIMSCLKWAQDIGVPMNSFDKDPSIFGILQVCWNWQSKPKGQEKAEGHPIESIEIHDQVEAADIIHDPEATEVQATEESTESKFELELANPEELYQFDMEAVMTAIMGAPVDSCTVDLKSKCLGITYFDDGQKSTAYLPYVDVAQHAFKWALQNKVNKKSFEMDQTLFGILEVCHVYIDAKTV